MHTHIYTYIYIGVYNIYIHIYKHVYVYVHMFRLRLLPPGRLRVFCIVVAVIVAMSVITFSKSESVYGHIGRPDSMNMKCPHKIGREGWVWDVSDYIMKKKIPGSGEVSLSSMSHAA